MRTSIINATNQKYAGAAQGNLNFFRKISERELRNIISQLKSSTCSLDAIPTSFFKKVVASFILDVLHIVNCPLESGIFLDPLKTALVKPLLKKHTLDSSALSNYRPISNLPFLGKILERAVLIQLEAFLHNNDIYE